MAGSSQGIQLPISLQISNLADVASQLKQFAGKNILADSLGGKKIEGELNSILRALAQIETRAKNAFKTNADFSGLERDINKIELSLEHVQTTIKGLDFKDLKISPDAAKEIAELEAQIRKLNNGFNTFKAGQKDKLLQNVDFKADLSTAFGTKAGSMLDKNYDAMYTAIKNGMDKVNRELMLQKARFEQNSQIVTQNTTGRANFTAWGALEWIEKAFEKLPKDSSKYSEQQKMLSKYMSTATDEAGNTQFTNFKQGALGANGFFKELASRFQITPDQLQQIRKNVTEAAKLANKTASEELAKIATDRSEGARVFGNGLSAEAFKASRDQYVAQLSARDTEGVKQDNLQAQADAAQSAYKILLSTQQEVQAAQAELANALKAPNDSLAELQSRILSSVTTMPQLGQAFSQATTEIYQLREAADAGRAQLAQLDTAIGKLSGISNFINRYVGIYAIMRRVISAVKNAFNNIKELDKNITNIAVVTNMSQADLWGKIGEYTQMAQQFGVATKDVYTVSQLFYQQGLQTNQVMSLTTETLKMAKISGMGYEDAANAMTVAIRAFRVEMTEAQQVTDTYSALAAKFAVSSSEIANAMEKTASSAANVGMSLQSTSAFISVMTQTTRESAQNIGSALKSIISRYGEMKASPSKLLNVDGEDVAFNKVDTALKSIGISIKDSAGQFRDFDEVIMELAKKWDTLDNNTQRYVATVMAGNRQQSRFIALVSNYDELSRAMDTANNAENASIVQTAKTMDSLESKAQQLKNAFSQVYLDLHIEDGLKNAYDWLTRIMKTISKLGVGKGVLPTLANVIGFGTGTKSLINLAKDKVMTYKGNIQKKIELNTEEANKKADELQAKLEKEAIKRVEVQADTTQMQAQVAAMEASLITKQDEQRLLVSKINTTLPAGKTITQEELLAAQQEGKFANKEAIGKFLNLRNVNPDSDQGKALTNYLEQFQNATSEIQSLTSSIINLKTVIEGLTGAKEEEKGAGEQVVGAKHDETTAGQQATNAKKEEADSSYQTANAKKEDADGSYAAGEANKAEAEASLLAKQADEAEALAKEQQRLGNSTLAQRYFDQAVSLRASIPSTKQPPIQPQAQSEEIVKNGINWKKNDWGSGKGRTVAGILTSAARMLGTGIAASGAANEDKSTDTGLFGQKVEKSKILMGLGNGLSGAGTGASMGMMLGPWGAVIGAVGGFLISGLGAIIDGANMTLEEQLQLEKEEARKASEKALKQQAKVTDLDSSIDNLKKLKSAMYDSNEDMQAYQEAMSNMADQYPQLVSSYDEAGNAIIDLNAAEMLLAQTRAQASKEANNSAKAEAQVRQTTIKTLQDAQSTITDLKTAGSGWTFYEDQGGTSHAFYDYSNWNNAVDALKEYFVGEAVDSWSNAQKIQKLMEVDWGITDVKNKGFAQSYQKSFQLDENGNIIPENESTFENNLKIQEINEILKNRAEDLGISAAAGVGEDNAYIYGLMGWDSTVEMTAEHLKQFEAKLAERVNGYESMVETLDQSLPIADAQESLDVALTWKDAAKASKISTSKVATKLIANQLELAAKSQAGVSSAGEWSRTEDAELASAYSAEKTTATENVVKWLTEMTDTALDSTLTVLGSMTQYLSKDAVLSALGYSDAEDFISRSGLDEEAATDLLDSLQKSFVDANTANRDRILKTIYNYDKNGNQQWTLNKELIGLEKLNSKTYLGTDQRSGQDLYKSTNQALDIAYMFGEYGNKSATIISKYADYFTTQLVSINKLAEDGYTELAGNRLDVLHGMASSLSKIKDSNVQNELFKTITAVDFSSYDSILTASRSLEEFGKKENKIAEISPILTVLTEAANQLVFNVNTLAQELTTTITNAAKDIDSILTTNKTGVTFDKAIESFTKLDAAFEDIDSFDDVFSYDAQLGKYVYTVNGMQKAIANKEQELATKSQQLTETAKMYTEQITVKKNGKTTAQGNWNTKQQLNKDTDFKDADTLFTALQTKGVLNSDLVNDTKFKTAYQNILGNFIKTTSSDKWTLENLKKFVEQQAESAEIDSDAAIILEKEFQANKKNQIYSAIDWNKLATGSDYTSNNQAMVNMLADELGVYQEFMVGDQYGNLTKHKRYPTWEEIQDAYFNEVYGEEESDAKTAAKTAAKGAQKQAKSQQISTAINEILQGAGTALSDTTVALLNEAGGLDLSYADGVLEAGSNFVEAALELYNSAENGLNTIAEKNQAYLEIINASFKPEQAAQTLLSSGSQLDFSTLSASFTDMGLTLDKYWDAKNKDWKNGLEDVLKTDQFGKITIKNWDNYVKFLEKAGIDIQNMDQEMLAKYRRAYTDSLISNKNDLNVGKARATQFTNLANGKVGDIINVTDLVASKDERITNILKKAGTLVGDELTLGTEQQIQQATLAMDELLSDKSWVLKHQPEASAIKTVIAQAKTKFNKNEAWKGVIAEKTSYQAAQTLQDALGRTLENTDDFMKTLGFTWDDYTKQFIAGAEAVGKIQAEIDNISDGEAKNNLQALLNNLDDIQSFKKENALKDVLSNYTNVTNEMIANFTTAFDIDLEKYVSVDAQGNKRVNIGQLRTALESTGYKINEIFNEQMASIYDTNLQNLNTAASLVSTGTSNQADIAKFKKSYKELTGTEVSNTAFSFDNVLNAWTLDPTVLQDYVEAQAQELVRQGLLSTKELSSYVDTNVRQALANQIDISSFLSAENKSEDGQAYKTLEKALSNYMNSSDEIFAKFAGQYTKYQTKILDSKELEKWKNTEERYSNEAITKFYIDRIKAGGLQAVSIMNSVAKAQGKELSSSDIESAYRAQVSEIESAFESLTATPGTVISGQAVEILSQLKGADITLLGDTGSAVINSITDVSEAYVAYYEALRSTGEATLSALNEAKAKVLETQNGRAKEQQAITTLGDAAGMTYSTFGQLLSDMGIELTDNLMNELTNANIVKALGGNKMQIVDFSAFARRMNWSFDSEEYLSAFSSFNEGLVDQNRQNRVQVADELNKLKDIKPGDWLNLTRMTNELQKWSKQNNKDFSKELKNARIGLKQMQKNGIGSQYIKEQQQIIEDLESKDYFTQLQQSLIKAGGYLDDGILKLSDNANILDISTTLSTFAQTLGGETAIQAQDMVQSILQTYTSAITKGIEGGMTNAERVDLDLKAKHLGIAEDLDYTETAEGLKLSQKSAIVLYQAISSINILQGRVTFEKLKTNLEKNNKEFETSNNLLTHIAELQQQIEDIEPSDARRKELEAELAVAKQINAERLIQGETDWNFMNQNGLPGSFTNAIEYWQGWATVSQNLNTAASKQFIDPQQLATMFQHVYQIAEATGKPQEFMGFSTDTMDFNSLLNTFGQIISIDEKTGQAMLTAKKLKELGINLKLGAKGISDGLKDASKEYASMNQKQLANIHEFYTNLSDLKTTLDKEKINWEEFFTDDKFDYGKFNSKLKDHDKALKAFNEFLGKVTVNNKKLSNQQTGMEQDATVNKTLKSIFKMMSAEDWDASTGYATIAEHLKTSGFEGDLDLGDMQFRVTAGHVLQKAKEGKWTDPETNTEYDSIEAAYDAMNERDLEDFKKQFNQYKRSDSGDNIITIDGLDYTIKIKDGKITYTYTDENGKTQTGSADTMSQMQEDKYEEYKKTSGREISREAWNAKQKTDIKSFQETGTVSTATREYFQSQQITTASQLANDYNNFMESMQKKGLDEQHALYEYQAKTGLKFQLGAEINWDSIEKQVKMSQGAQDVMDGISAAFSGENGKAITQTIGQGIQAALAEPAVISTEVSGLDAVRAAIEAVANAKYTATIDVQTGKTASDSNVTGGNGRTNMTGAQQATGNIGLAKAGGTLMGELGPELVVSGGRYFVVGTHGPEMVDLAKDSIVFNHLQTASLLSKGTSSTRGRAITDEKTAVAYATGSIHGGIAKTNGDVTAAAEDTNGSDVWTAGLNRNGKKPKDFKAFLKDLERWYNWLQKIAELETKITYQETLRSKLQSDMNKNGQGYYRSQKESLKLLQEEVTTQQSLVREQEAYFEKRRKELNSDNNPFSSLYTFDENGQLKYKNGKFEEFQKMVGSDKFNNPNMSPEKQYQYITKTLGVSAEYMQRDASGNKVKAGDYNAMIKAFWDKVEKDQKEMQGLHDSINEHKKALLEAEQKQNEILKAIQDNQIAVENEVLKAVESEKQMEIDEQQKLRDAIEEGNSKLIQGLTDAMNREKTLYENNQTENELTKLQRQLAILQRSGGSAAEIGSLQQQINEKSQDVYFNKQQEEIDLIQQASDLQIEKLDEQIKLMTDTLAYEKEHGLLWTKVAEIMQGTPESIFNYIKSNNKDFWSMSPTELAQKQEEQLFQAEQWAEYRDDTEAVVGSVGTIEDLIAGRVDKSYIAYEDSLKEKYGDKYNKLTDEQKAQIKKLYMDEYNKSGDANKAREAVENSKFWKKLKLTAGSGGNGNGNDNGNGDGNGNGNGNENGSNGNDSNKKKWRYKFYNDGATVDSGLIYKTQQAALTAGYAKRNAIISGYRSSGQEDKVKFVTMVKTMEFDTGGYDYTTGPAILHGTKSKPEAIFNAPQTKILRDNILSNRPGSLINLLKSYNDAYKGLSSNTYDSISDNSNTTTIEHAEVNMNVSKLANGYDASRAGEDVMREMLRIASKSNSNNRVGR